MKRCQGESYCKAFNPERSNCHEYCIGFIQLQNIYSLSDMPKRFQFPKQLQGGVDRENFIKLKGFEDNIVEHVRNGDGLFLTSATKGNGKTSWACRIMNEYFRHVAIKNNLRCRGLYVNVPEFFRELKDSFDNPTTEFRDKLDHLKSADLVIWDDIGTESPTSFVRDTLYTFINYRYGEMKSQIFTSNATLEQMEDEKWLGERIVSRIVGSGSTIVFEGHDRREEDR